MTPIDTSKTLIRDIEFPEVKGFDYDNNRQWAHHGEFGSLTVLDRMTGFTDGYGGGVRDTETGFRSPKGGFWLYSGRFDIREFPELTIDQAIEKIKTGGVCCRPEEESEK